MRIKAFPGLPNTIIQAHLSNSFPIVSRVFHFVWSFVWSEKSSVFMIMKSKRNGKVMCPLIKK